MRQRQETDVLIIGGGAVGICSAHYLKEKGRDVTVVEKGAVCSACSAANGGLIVPSYSTPLASPGKILKGLKWMFNPESPFSIKFRPNADLIRWMLLFHRASGASRFRAGVPVLRDLNHAGLILFKELAALDGLDFGLSEKGFLALFKSPEGREEGLEEARLMGEFGIPSEMVDGSGVGRMAGGLKTRATGGVFFPGDAHLDPRQFTTALAAHVRSQGVTIRESTEVIGFHNTGNRITAVQTTRGEIAAREIVLAGGAWSAGIIRELKVKMPMQPSKGYSVTFERTDACPVIPMGLLEAKVVLTPLDKTFRVAGTMEFAGFDRTYQKRRIQAVVNSIPAYFPDVDPSAMDVVEIWQGFRPCSPDGLPYLGRPKHIKNLIVAAGHGMLGVTQAPISGKIVARLAAGEDPALDIAPLSPDRYRRF